MEIILYRFMGGSEKLCMASTASAPPIVPLLPLEMLVGEVGEDDEPGTPPAAVMSTFCSGARGAFPSRETTGLDNGPEE